MFRLEITDTAECDLDRITDYLGITLSNLLKTTRQNFKVE